MKLEQRQPAVILVKCLASPLEGPRAHADKRPHTCQLIEHFQFHNPHSTCTSTCDKPRAGAHWGSSQSLELAQPSSQHPTVICTRSGTSRPISRDLPSYESARRPLRFAGNVGVFNEASDTGVICTAEQASLCGTK